MDTLISRTLLSLIDAYEHPWSYQGTLAAQAASLPTMQSLADDLARQCVARIGIRAVPHGATPAPTTAESNAIRAEIRRDLARDVSVLLTSPMGAERTRRIMTLADRVSRVSVCHSAGDCQVSFSGRQVWDGGPRPRWSSIVGLISQCPA